MELVEQSRPYTRNVLAWAWVAVLGCAVLFGGLALLPLSAQLATRWPEFSDLRLPLLTLALAFGATVLLELPFCAAAVSALRAEPHDDRSLRRAVTAVAAISAGQLAILVAVLTLIPGPPALALLLIAVAVCVLVVLLRCLKLRSRLRA